MKVVLFGSTGMLGNYIKHYFQDKTELICITRKDYDISGVTYESLDKLLKDYKVEKNDVVINAAGCIPQKQQDYVSYYLVNTIFPLLLSKICKYNSYKLIHITTDCVYNGDSGNYCELDRHSETNMYGISKSLGEQHTGTTIRTSIIGEENTDSNFSLLEWVRHSEDKNIMGYVNHKWNGITCLQLTKIIYTIINEDRYWEGTYHIFSPNHINKYELIKMIANVYNIKTNITEFETPQKIDKTLISYCEFINDYFKIPCIYDQIVEQKEYNLYSRTYSN